MLVAVAEMVLAELTGGIAVGLEHVGDAGIERPEPELGAVTAIGASGGCRCIFALRRRSAHPAGQVEVTGRGQPAADDSDR